MHSSHFLQKDQIFTRSGCPTKKNKVVFSRVLLLSHNTPRRKFTKFPCQGRMESMMGLVEFPALGMDRLAVSYRENNQYSPRSVY